LNKIRADKVRFTPQIDELLQEIADNSPCHEEIVDASLLIDFIFDETKSTTKDMAILHYVDGLTLEETAKMMKMSVSGVRKRLSGLRSYAKQFTGE
jgi:RNA polymerase sigma-70 factor (ECF subfamily)